VGVNPGGRRAYIANRLTDQLHVVDGLAHAVVANIDMAQGPSAVVLNPAETRAYVLHPGTGATSQLSIINAENRGTLGTIVFAHRAERLEMSADGTRLFVSHNLANSISVVSTATNAVLASMSTGAAPYGMAYDRNLDRLYVANSGGNSLSIFDAGNRSLVATVPIAGCANPRNVAVNPQGSRLFVTCEDSDAVAAIELASLAVTLVPVGPRPTAVEVTPDGERLRGQQRERQRHHPAGVQSGRGARTGEYRRHALRLRQVHRRSHVDGTASPRPAVGAVVESERIGLGHPPDAAPQYGIRRLVYL
jgi:YVTN family beta-propeller protein